MKKIIFEILAIIEKKFIMKNTKEYKSSEHIMMSSVSKRPKNIFLFSGNVNTYGGSGTALKLINELAKLNLEVGLIMPSLNSKIVKNYLNFHIIEFNSEFNENTNFILTNWQSYHEYYNLYDRYNRKFMFVQDMEYLFFPYSSTYVYARKPYIDSSIHKVCLGDWIPSRMSLAKGDVSSVPFPVTLVQEDISNKKKINNHKEIIILCYIKHSFRRAGTLMLMQLEKLPLKILDKNIKVKVVGYKPTILTKKLYPSNIIFKGFISENELKSVIEEADIGLSYSLTNVSLLPYQFLHLRKPFIDIIEGGSEIQQIKENMILTDGTIDGLQKSIELAIKKIGKIDNLSLTNIHDTAKSFKVILNG